MLEGVLPYLKAAVPEDDNAPVFELSAADSPLLEPFVGRLLVSYVVDETRSFRLVTEREFRASGLSQAQLRQRAIANLAERVVPTGVRLVPHRSVTAVLFDGNLEATLMLWEDLFPHLHEKHGPELLAVAPSRDVLAVSAPANVDELREVVERVWPGGDHLLTKQIFRRFNGAWSVRRPE
jgi:uncharacterized protein YtpQ (UPF0354 family)